jgi:hypothetical protein
MAGVGESVRTALRRYKGRHFRDIKIWRRERCDRAPRAMNVMPRLGRKFGLCSLNVLGSGMLFFSMTDRLEARAAVSGDV